MTESDNLRATLSNIERETVILYNEAEKMATISTTNVALTRRLDEMSEEFDEVVFIKRDRFGAEYEVPKNLVTIRKPRKLTEKQRQALVDRMNRINKEKEEIARVKEATDGGLS